MKIRTRVAGKVHYNDGEFAEIQTVGTEGIDENLFLDTIQLHREDTELSLEQFQHGFPVGMWLDIWTTTEISPKHKVNHQQIGADSWT